MSDLKMKLLIFLLILIIIAGGGFLYYTITTEQSKLINIEEQVKNAKEEEKRKELEMQKKEEEKKSTEETVIGINDTKIYNQLIKRVINKNVYIEVEVAGIKTIKAYNGDMLLEETGDKLKIYRDGYLYDINKKDGTGTMSTAVTPNLNISFIDTNISKYIETGIKIGIEEINGLTCEYEELNNIKYYFENNKLVYVKKDNEVIKINSVSEPNSDMFIISPDYQIYDTNVE